MKMVWHGVELDLTIDELEDMYTRGLLGPIEFSEDKSDPDSKNWDELIKSFAKRLPTSMNQTVALYGVPSQVDSIDSLHSLNEALQSTKVQSSTVEIIESNDGDNKDEHKD